MTLSANDLINLDHNVEIPPEKEMSSTSDEVVSKNAMAINLSIDNSPRHQAAETNTDNKTKASQNATTSLAVDEKDHIFARDGDLSSDEYSVAKFRRNKVPSLVQLAQKTLLAQLSTSIATRQALGNYCCGGQIKDKAPNTIRDNDSTRLNVSHKLVLPLSDKDKICRMYLVTWVLKTGLDKWS